MSDGDEWSAFRIAKYSAYVVAIVVVAMVVYFVVVGIKGVFKGGVFDPFPTSHCNCDKNCGKCKVNKKFPKEPPCTQDECNKDKTDETILDLIRFGGLGILVTIFLVFVGAVLRRIFKKLPGNGESDGKEGGVTNTDIAEGLTKESFFSRATRVRESFQSIDAEFKRSGARINAAIDAVDARIKITTAQWEAAKDDESEAALERKGNSLNALRDSLTSLRDEYVDADGNVNRENAKLSVDMDQRKADARALSRTWNEAREAIDARRTMYRNASRNAEAAADGLKDKNPGEIDQATDDLKADREALSKENVEFRGE